MSIYIWIKETVDSLEELNHRHIDVDEWGNEVEWLMRDIRRAIKYIEAANELFEYVLCELDGHFELTERIKELLREG